MPTPDASFFVDPFMSERRVFVCQMLANVLPNSHTVLASNDKATADKFREMTGVTQSVLESQWTSESFAKGPTGSWTRPEGVGGAVFTSCEGLIMTVFTKLEQNGFGKRAGKATAFNLANNEARTGRETDDIPVGWHWYRDKAPGNVPLPGDMFQLATPAGADKQGRNRWTHEHVGVITRWTDDALFPKWEVVHAGQGGPRQGFDTMKRKPYGFVFPLGSEKSKLTIMGWLNIDEHFG